MSVKVLARIRPLLKAELDRDIIVTAHSSSPEGQQADAYPTVVHIPNPKNEGENYSFQFNRVFESRTTQKDLFEAEIKPTVKHLFSGFDVTLFAYGVTGTGKTHTMRGGKSLEERGIIPRLLSAIYRKSRAMTDRGAGATQIDVSMSYYEIYCDKVYDLFQDLDKRSASGLPLRDNGSRTVVVGLTERPCEDLKTFEKLYDQANVNRSTSATKLNAHSSRSHAILCVKLAVTQGDRTTVSTASCIDLAGSEDNRRTENNKERLVESSAINKSLFVLGQCVEAISKGQARIPYRESKMTRILSLGQNNGLCICLLNLAPIRSYHLDTLSSLNFANRTKKIEVREVENEPVFHGCSRPAVGLGSGAAKGASVQRQPLKALSSMAHNANLKRPSAGGAELASKPALKPIKAFTVFSDKSRPTVARRASGEIKRSSPAKRKSGGGFAAARPKAFGRSPTAARRIAAGIPAGSGLSRTTIEDMIERKVGEMLAAKAMEQPLASAQPEISDEVKRRLEMLEQRIEAKGGEDERAEGLSYLLMAKQHLARGEEGSALKMYELARDYFPENAKLESRIRKLQDKLGAAKKDGGSKDGYVGKENIPPIEEPMMDGDGEYRDEEYGEDGDYDDFDGRFSARRPAAKRQRRTKVLVTPLADEPEDSALLLSPRGRQLLDIINTRDLIQIRALKGVGAKKAESIVDAMADKENLGSLTALAGLKGVGVKTVENMRLGLAV